MFGLGGFGRSQEKVAAGMFLIHHVCKKDRDGVVVPPKLKTNLCFYNLLAVHVVVKECKELFTDHSPIDYNQNVYPIFIHIFLGRSHER